MPGAAAPNSGLVFNASWKNGKQGIIVCYKFEDYCSIASDAAPGWAEHRAHGSQCRAQESVHQILEGTVAVLPKPSAILYLSVELRHRFLWRGDPMRTLIRNAKLCLGQCRTAAVIAAFTLPTSLRWLSLPASGHGHMFVLAPAPLSVSATIRPDSFVRQAVRLITGTPG